MAYDLGDALGYIRLNIQDFESKMDKVQQDSKALQQTVKTLGGAFSAAGKVAAAAFTAITTASTAAVKSVIQVGSSFEASMSGVAATMGMTSDQIANNVEEYQKLTEAAREMGATTKFTATQAAQALNYLALAGYGVEESVTMLPKVLNAAAAGGMDLASASDMVTDAMSALGLSIDEADSFVDKLAKTAQSSNTTVAQLGAGILQIGGTAKMLVGGVTELDTALGVLANNGIKAAEGGTALRQILLNLTAPTEKARKFMEEIGFSAYDAAGNMKPLNQTFAELDAILQQTSNDMERQKIITEIFDARQLKSANALLANYGQAWDNLYAKVEASEGAASRMAKTMGKNLTGAITIMKSALEGVGITAYEALKQNLTDAAVSATESLDKLNKKLQSEELQKALSQVSKLIGDILSKFAEFVSNSAIPNLITWVANLQDVVTALKSILAGLAAALPIVAAGLVICNKTVQLAIAQFIALKGAVIAANAALLLNPYTAVAAGIGIVVAATVNYVSKTNQLLEAARNQTTEFSKMADAVNENAQALEDAKYAAEETSATNTEQINQIRTLTNMLTEYAQKTELSATELASAQSIIEQLNQLYPLNTAYIEDGQIKAYEGLTTAVQNYTEQLYYAAQLEAQQELSVQAYTSMKEAEESMNSYAEAVNNTAEAYQRAKKDLDYYNKGKNNYRMKDKKAADAQGITIKQYYQTQYEARKADWENAVEAYTKNKELYAESKALYEQYEQDILGIQLKAGIEVEGVYKDQHEAYIAEQQKYSEDYTKREQALHAEEIEAKKKAEEEKVENSKKILDDLEELETKYKLREIKTEEELMSEKAKLFNQDWDKTNQDLIEEYSKLMDYQEDQAEKQRQENEKQIEEQKRQQEEQKAVFEQGIKDKVSDLEYRNSIDETYTKEMMYTDIEVIRDGLDTESDLFKELNRKVILGRKELGDKLATETQATAEANFKAWQDSYNAVVSEAEEAEDKIKTAQTNLTQSMINSVELYETTTKKVWDRTQRQFVEKDIISVSTKNLKKQTKELENYQKTLDSLQSKGASENLMSKILGMDTEEGEKFAQMLNKMSEKELKNYSESYDELVKKSEEFSAKYYEQQIQTFQTNYTNKINDLLHNIPKDSELVGEDTVKGFIKGIESKQESSTGTMKSWLSNIIATTKEELGIHSPSKVYMEMGENLVEGMVIGVSNLSENITSQFAALGQSSGQAFIQKFQTSWGGFIEWFKNSLSGLGTMFETSTIASSSFAPITQQKQTVISPQIATSQTQSSQSLTRADIVSAIREAQPDGDVILTVDGQKFGSIARATLNQRGRESGRLQLNI